MTTATTISVTRDQIKRGARRSLTDCPVALAIREGHGGSYISVSRTCAVWATDSGVFTTSFPLSVQMWIGEFDAYGHRDQLEPFEFSAEWTEATS